MARDLFQVLAEKIYTRIFSLPISELSSILSNISQLNQRIEEIKFNLKTAKLIITTFGIVSIFIKIYSTLSRLF